MMKSGVIPKMLAGMVIVFLAGAVLLNGKSFGAEKPGEDGLAGFLVTYLGKEVSIRDVDRTLILKEVHSGYLFFSDADSTDKPDYIVPFQSIKRMIRSNSALKKLREPHLVFEVR
jgi:hypothetical protein